MNRQASPSPARPALAPPSDLAEQAYRRVRPELAAMADDEPGRITLNMMRAMLTMLGALPALEALRQAIEALPGLAPGLVDKARDYAYALAHVHAMSLPSTEIEARVEALLAEGMPLRDRLLSTAELGVKFGLFDAEQVASVRSGTGRVDAANDILALSRMFRGRWPELEGKVPVTIVEVERAGALGLELLDALGQRQVGAENAHPMGEYERARVKLLHLLLRTHGQLLRAVTYLRWDEGDAGAILPSLFQGRPRRKRAAEAPAPRTPTGPQAPAAGGEGEP
jgi:hypothetical protein